MVANSTASLEAQMTVDLICLGSTRLMKAEIHVEIPEKRRYLDREGIKLKKWIL